MNKSLSQMTLEELWQLFPIVLTAPDPGWQEWYRQEEALLHSLLPTGTVISHIGSTAIKGIWAKPIVDILVELPAGSSLTEAGERITQGGYRCMSRSEGRCSFNKGYTENGFAEKVFHLHLRYAGDHDELYFRDYLNAHPEAARAYETLKLSLWRQYEHDRDGYSAAKTELVRRYTAKALKK